MTVCQIYSTWLSKVSNPQGSQRLMEDQGRTSR